MADPADADGQAVQPAPRLDDATVRGLLAVLNDQLDQLEAMPGPLSQQLQDQKLELALLEEAPSPHLAVWSSIGGVVQVSLR